MNKLSIQNDRALLAFIFARFIDGEFTGLKEGNALNYAPNLAAADFLARQIRDEIRHAEMYRTLYRLCAGDKAIPRGPVMLQWIMAPVTGRLWMEHCFLDKAVGERWVLSLMESLLEAVEDRRIVNNLKAIAKDERTHIEFGVSQTRTALGESRFRRYYLWGLYLRVDFALALAYRLLKSLISRRYSPAAAGLLAEFFTNSRHRIFGEVAELLDVPARRSLMQMLLSQLLFLIRFPFVGWFRSPRQTF